MNYTDEQLEEMAKKEIPDWGIFLAKLTPVLEKALAPSPTNLAAYYRIPVGDVLASPNMEAMRDEYANDRAYLAARFNEVFRTFAVGEGISEPVITRLEEEVKNQMGL